MRIGLDLDGTIVDYDALFHREAAGRFPMPPEVRARKDSVRDWLRTLPNGEERWIELQGLVYGPLMDKAPSVPGALEFLHSCRGEQIPVSIVSHRTPRAVADSSIDLHASARAWLRTRGITERVFLEPSRAAKLRRIESEGCALFVDDLPELLSEPAFPTGTERWLYDAGRPGSLVRGTRTFSDWTDVLSRARELQETARGS